VAESTRVSQVTPESPGIPRAMVYGLLRALPGDRAFLSPSPLRSLLLRGLTPASRRQDHTTSPSASGALVCCAVRVHRIPPHVRDDRETPLSSGGTARVLKLILAGREAEYFSQKGWTAFSKNNLTGKSVGSFHLAPRAGRGEVRSPPRLAPLGAMRCNDWRAPGNK